MKWPEDFKPLRKVEKLLQDKVKLFQTENKVRLGHRGTYGLCEVYCLMEKM